MPKFIIKYSKEFELDRVLSTLSEAAWYEKNGYKPILPASITVADKSDIEKIKKAINDEFNEGEYKKQEDYINENAFIISPIVTDFISGKIKRPAQDEYIIYLTKYGVGGSYGMPNRVIVNIKIKYERGLIRTLAHEIIHLSIEELVYKNKIQHWVKERIVDLLLLDAAPSMANLQRTMVNTEIVDKAFKDYFPDMEKVLINANAAN